MGMIECSVMVNRGSGANNEIYTSHGVEAWMLFMGSAWEPGSSNLDNLNMFL